MNAILIVFGSVWALIMGIPANSPTATQYIEKYKDLAISEMHRTNIPASIKMAQAILESGLGTSTLATQANNHFGIKCNGGWTGDTYYREDDDYKNGKLIKSCFRKYQNPAESFIAHSDFLVKQPRYGNLFLLQKDDYAGWAYGLREAGYATDKKYPSKLIDIINKYNLDELDKPSAIFAQADKSERETSSRSTKRTSETRSSGKRSSDKKSEWDASKRTANSDSYYASSKMNKTKVVVANGQVSLRQIAKDHKVELSDLKKYNDDLDIRSTSEAIPQGEVVFLEKRKKGYFGSNKYHIVKEGETMKSIARKYGVQLEFLYIKNRMPLSAQPLTGEKVHLTGIVRLKAAPQFTEKNQGRTKKRATIF